MIAFGLLVPLLLGALVLRVLGQRWRDEPWSALVWAWLAGCLVLGAGLQVGIVLGVPRAGVALAAFGLWLGVRRRRWADSAAPRASASPPPTPLGPGYAAFVLGGVVVCAALALAGADRPCIEGDEGNIWSLKAKSLLVDWPAFAAAQVHNLHPDYPQLDPLLQAWIYLLTGAPADTPFANRLPVQVCDVLLFVAVAVALRRRLPALPAASLSTLVLLEPEFRSLCTNAYADGMVALGMLVAVDGWLRWRDHGERRHGWLAGLGFAFALWSKNEPMLYLAAAAVAAALVRVWTRPIAGGFAVRNLVLLLPACAVVAATTLWNRSFGLRSDLLGHNPTGKSMFALLAEQGVERLPTVAGEALALCVSPVHAHITFVLLAAAVLLRPARALGARLALPVLALGGACVGLHVVYLGSFLPLDFHLATSHARVLFQLLPVAVLLLAELVRADSARSP